MSRWIDADAFIADIQERYCRPCKSAKLDYGGVKCKACMFDDEIDDVDGFADNSIDIVRCKECKWYDDGQNESDSWSMCTRHFEHYINVDSDDFCSYGEREGE